PPPIYPIFLALPSGTSVAMKRDHDSCTPPLHVRGRRPPRRGPRDRRRAARDPARARRGPRRARVRAALVRLGLAPPPWAVTARLLTASHAAGQLAWGPLGFTVRTVALCDAGMPLGAVVRVHVAERIAEAAGLAALALTALAFAPAAILGSWLGRLLFAGLAAAALAGLAVAASGRLRGLVVRYADTGGALARSSAWAFASSLGDVAVLWLAARGMHVSLDLPTAVLAFLAVNGATAVPVTPAQLGVQESAI